MKIATVILSVIALLVSSAGCGRTAGNASPFDVGVGDTLTCEASLLTIVDCGEYTLVDVKNPWDTASLLQRYILITEKAAVTGYPDGVVVNVPLRSSLVYSSVHTAAIKEMGAVGAVTGVCDASYYKIPEILSGLSDGTVTDVGSSMSPSVEKIVAFSPDAILTSPFRNAGHGAIAQLGIPVIECADYMETSPLGRAEWIKLLGELYGKRDVADSIYNAVVARYNEIREFASTLDSSPVVISEMVTDGVWYMPGGGSYMARLFKDAGAVYPWADDSSSGSLQLDFATVYDRAGDADVWLIKTFGRDLTLDELRSVYPLNARMEAFSNGGVYACNTSATSLFEDFPFHPDMLLEEYVWIFHPELVADTALRYFRRVR